MHFVLSVLLAAVCLLPAVSAYLKTPEANNDEVTNLPGLANPLPFKQYSGYLSVNAQKNIHYWFFESQNDPDNDPVALWTNGGPGCSGLIGLFEEHGPFRVGSDGNLIVQLSTSWNAIANFVYIEQPVGVGFSYSTNSSDYRTGDAQAAADNLQAILSFFTKYPGLAKNKFIITSESYGGHYMPTLALDIVNYNKGAGKANPLNFDGFLVGNPYTNLTENFIGTFETFCGKSLASHPTCAGIHANCYPYPGNAQCNLYQFAADMEVGNLDPYALDFPLCLSSQQRRRLNEFIYHKYPRLASQMNVKYEPCEENFETTYLNRADVQTAIHVQSTTWAACSNTIRYNQTDSDAPMNHYYKDLIAATGGTLHMTVLSGDDDSVCGTLGTTDWMYGLGLASKAPWTSWTDGVGQVGGYIVQWQQGLNLVTVHTAGHEVPAFQPDRAFQVWKNYVAKIW